MNLRFISALNRRRLRRRLLIESARLEEMRENAKDLISAQERAVEKALRQYDAASGVTSEDIARLMDRESKGALLA